MGRKYYIGFDLGSSSVKAALVDAATSENILSLHEPQHEMSILSEQSDWAEQTLTIGGNLCVKVPNEF